MKKALVVIPLLVLVTLAVAGPDDPAPAKAPEAAKKPEIAARGTFVPADATAAIPKPEGWRGRFVVESAVEPGTLVKKGDVVIRFDAEAITEAVKEGRIEMGHATVENEQALKRHAFGVVAADRELVKKEREYAHALRRVKDFEEYDKPREAARAILDRKGQDQTLQNAKDELAQLEKMYAEDELVDDTEDIVLERSRWNLERRTRYHEWWVQARERTEKVLFPRRDDDTAFDLARRKASIERYRAEYEMGKASRDIALERMKRAWAKKQSDFEKLLKVVDMMVVTAPADGILLHGPLEGALGREFKVGAQVNASVAVVSIATPGDLLVVLSVSAKEVLRLKTGLAVHIQPDAIGADAIETTVAYVSALPKGGNFVVRCSLPDGVPAALLGTGAAVKILLPEAK